uniref:helix-hairpin-helix domain-containing protein n=1 Tax=Ruminococcus bicirculans (ex Wegman et al. 2014) TaxID=1160721 RepID=UPI0040294D04
MTEKTFKFKIVPQQERFYNENSNWGVYTFTTTSNDIPYFYDCYDDPFGDNPRQLKGSTLAGKMQRLTIGVEYNAEVTCSFNSKYNSYQYTPISITANVPKTEEQQIAYLKTQVTELQAKNILAVYPNVIDDVIHNREIDFTKIKGIGERSWNRIKDNILNNYVISDILIMLQPLGVTYAMISKLISNEPNPQLLKEKLLDNPYIMTEIRGLGFKRVDDLALKLNPDIRISTKRVVAFIKYYLESVGNNDGHSYVLESVLDSVIRDNINDCYEMYESFKSTQKQHEIFLHFEENKVGLLRQYK